jgi:hypothetical protein
MPRGNCDDDRVKEGKERGGKKRESVWKWKREESWVFHDDHFDRSWNFTF